MVLVGLAVVVGAVIGFARPPLGAHLARPAVFVPGAALLGAVLHVAVGVFDVPWGGAVFGVSFALLAAFAIVNRHIVGMGVLAVGLVCNMVVVMVNGAMPVRASAVVAADIATPAQLADTDLGAGRAFAQDDDLLPLLGDIVPVPALGVVVSFGDLIALMGIGALTGDLVRQMRLRRDRRRMAWPQFVPARTVPAPADDVAADPMPAGVASADAPDESSYDEPEEIVYIDLVDDGVIWEDTVPVSADR